MRRKEERVKAWEKNFRVVSPYVPGEQPDFPDMIKLNTNENPYPPAPGVKRVMENFAEESLRLYPSMDAAPLVLELAHYYGRKEDEIFVGVGSDDVLAVAFMTFFGSEKPILFPDVTYSFYEVWAELYRIPYERPPLDEHFRLLPEDYKKENGGIVLANPNAPTSICEPISLIEEILSANGDSVVIVDEAYIDFGGVSALTLLDRYENLLVVQTFSKARSMAGMRIGYAMGNKALIAAMNRVKFSINSYTMSRPAILLGVEAVRDREYFEKTLHNIITTREESKARLEQMGFVCLDSKTNFLFVTHKKISAAELYEALREQHIFVRYFNKPRIREYLRITIGTREEMHVLLKFLEKYRV